jgi:hypothetical protein
MIKNLRSIHFKKHSLLTIIVVVALSLSGIEHSVIHHNSNERNPIYKSIILNSQIIKNADALPACTVNCFAFNYSRSGGLRSAHEAISYNTDTKELIFNISKNHSIKRQLSDSEIENLKDIISNNIHEFNIYEPSGKAADYYNYTLTILLNGGTHRASWTDASSGVPVGLLNLKKEIEKIATLPK